MNVFINKSLPETGIKLLQDKGINQDFGVFDTPDEFYAQHQQQLSPLKKFIFRTIVRHKMNKNVARIRKGY